MSTTGVPRPGNAELAVGVIAVPCGVLLYLVTFAIPGDQADGGAWYIEALQHLAIGAAVIGALMLVVGAVKRLLLAPTG